MQVIIFPQENGGVSVVYQAPTYQGSIADLAARTVPEGAAWRVIDTADLPDTAARDLWRWTASGPLEVAPSPPPPVPPEISFAQMLIGLVAEAWITEAEGTAWLSGALPPQVEALIATLPADQRFAARARAARPSIVRRSDPLLVALGAAQGKTPEQLDAFFTTYAQA